MNRFFCVMGRPLVSVLFLALLLIGISACSGGGSSSTNPPPRSLTSISVSANTTSVAAGLTAQFKATGTYSDSTSADITSSVTWTSATTSVATISSSGLATTKAKGTSIITATSGAVSGSATLTVNAAALVSIAVNSATVQLGSSTQLKATGTYTDASTRDVSAEATWTSTNPYVATVSASGGVASIQPGLSTVTATDATIKASASLTVLASPRYLYVGALAARTLTRMAVDSTTGQPRFEGYTKTSLSNNIGFPCLTVDPSGTHAYLSTQVRASGGSGYTGSVAIYSVNQTTGAFTEISSSPVAVTFPLGCVRFDPSGKFAYATSGIEGAGDQLGTFAVNADATLTLNSTASFPHYPTGVVVDPLGQFVYVDVIDVAGGTGGSSDLYGYSIDQATGALNPLTGSPWAMDAGIYGLLSMHPAGNSLYASDLNNKNVVAYTVDRTSGVPTKAGTVDSTCINPSALQFLPDGTHAYLVCSESSARSTEDAPIVEFTVDASGQLAEHSTAFAGPAAQQLQVDPSAKFVYVLGSGSDSSGSTVAMNTVLAYQVQPDGSLKLTRQVAGHVLAETMALVSGPTPVTWTTTGAWITTAGDNQLTPYSVAADGTVAPGTNHGTADGPFSLTMLPWGSDHLYALKTGPPNLFGQSESGGGSAFGTAASTGGIVIDPTGRYAYATDPAGGAVDVFYSGTPGFWSPLYQTDGFTPYTFTAGAGAGPITMDPSGRYIVVANQTAKSISLIEPLGAAPTPDTPLTYTPLAITVDSTGNLIFVAGDDGKLHMLQTNGLGKLTELATGTLAGMNTVSIAVEPLSRFVYTAGPTGVNAFTIDTTAGTLSPISLSVPVSLANATGVFLEPSGKYLYVPVSSGSNNALYLFTINSDGTLTASPANPVASPKDVTSIAFHASIQ